jgi:hypothetical protein
MIVPCKVCKSPYRAEIEALAKQRVTQQDIARRYFKLFNTNEDALVQVLWRHFGKKHPPLLLEVEPLEVGTKPVSNFDEYAARLLRIGNQNLDIFPGKVTPNHVIAAKRTQIEEAKVKNQIDASKVMILKFFRDNVKVIEGETVDDSIKQLGSENLPSDTD